MKITRDGQVAGRWPRYWLVIDGETAGLVTRTMTSSGDRMRGQDRLDAWETRLGIFATRDEAEAAIIQHHTR